MLVQACNPRSLDNEAGGSQVQDQPGIYSEFETSLGYIAKCCLKKEESHEEKEEVEKGKKEEEGEE
jgi:hypothetical protein